MNLDQLKTFVAVAETGSLRAASEKCHISQPAVTRQMQLLEERVGTKLLIHYGRGIRLTPAGSALHQEALHIFHAIEASLQKVNRVSGNTQNQIRLGISHYAAIYKLPPCIVMFRKMNPGIQLLFQYGTSEEMIERVEKGNLTFSIGTLPKRTEKLIQIQLWVDTFVAIFPGEHPYSCKRELTLEDLADTDLILPQKGTATRVLIDRAFKARGITVFPLMEVTYLETIKASVKMGIGASILPRKMFLKTNHEWPNIEIRPIKDPPITRQLGLVYKKGRELFQHEKEFVSSLRRDGGRSS